MLDKFIDFDEVELLPVNKGKSRYYILHEIKAYKLTGEIVKKDIKFRYVFNEKELTDCGIEKKLFIKTEMNHGVLSDLFYTERFVELVEKLNLQGVNFEVEWDSEENN